MDKGIKGVIVVIVNLMALDLSRSYCVLSWGSSCTLRFVPDCAVPRVSDKVLRIILSYTDYVRRVVWHQLA